MLSTWKGTLTLDALPPLLPAALHNKAAPRYPQLCRFFQGDVLTICSGGTYSMGGSTECHQCPSGWICENGLAAPCGHGTSMTPITTNTKMKGVGDSPASSVVDASSGEACVSCSPGGQCPGGGVWEACPPGTFSPGGDASNVCQPCPPGNFTNHSATVECYSCHAGEIEGSEGTADRE